MRFWKYHALGNDYIVMDPEIMPAPLTIKQVKAICHRNFGVGSDGILLGPLPSTKAPFGLRIYNPDGSQAEKSGNGLRIFSRYLWDRKLVGEKEFAIETAGGVVKSTVFESGKMVRVEMGKVTFWSNEIPVTGPRREVINEKILVAGETFTFCAASVGNPHCVLVGRATPCAPASTASEASKVGGGALTEITPEIAKQFGPHIETHSNFPNRINVQFLKILDRANIQIEIWERGAGYTLASGSSSSAAAAVAHKLGLCDRSITVHMPGGKLAIEISQDFDILMTGPVTRVAEGALDTEIFSAAGQ
jgi:diaminopimelate epimerase